jgi:alanine-glyoxylate transaminase/serine-glyoxylate transaminase/serine-pyruvate transaminase
MPKFNISQAGHHFLQIPGPTNVPDRILRAIAQPTIDHRGPAFGRLGREVLDGLKKVFRTSRPVIIYPSSGTGAWEAALVNTLSSGDRVVMFETGHFATLWRTMAENLGLDVEFVPGDWRHGVDPAAVEARLADDRQGAVKALCVVHNETSTGVVSPIAEIGRAIDRAGHGALFMVDTISSLGSMDYRHEEWGVDVTIGGSQKGLMLPPGLGFNALSDKALAAAQTASLPRSYWDWGPMVASNETGFFPFTPATNLLFGLNESVHMLLEVGLAAVFARHARLAEATRRAVDAWGLEMVAADPAERSNSLTAVLLPDGHDADAFRKRVLERFNMSLGSGLGRLQGKAFRIGHLGDFNDLMLAGALAGVEMGLNLTGVPFNQAGLLAALDFLVAEQGS